MYVCVYTYIYIYIHTHVTHTHYIYIYIYIYTCVDHQPRADDQDEGAEHPVLRADVGDVARLIITTIHCLCSRQGLILITMYYDYYYY